VIQRIIFILIISSFMFSACALAQNSDLTIDGNNVSYDKENKLFEAKGSVEVAYKDIKVTGEHIFYNADKEEINAREGFVFFYGGITIEGDSLDYLTKSKTGAAKKVAINYGGIYLKGEDVNFSEEEFDLTGAYFTTCDRNDYYVTARNIVFYPDYGWMVAYWGWFWFYGVPLLPMPTYIYDLYADQKGRKNLPPFPEISSNDEDGTYINEKLAWHLRRELSGTYSLTHAAKKGFGLGAEAYYVLNEYNEGRLRAYWNQTDLWSGGETHTIYFGRQIVDLDTKFGLLPRAKYYEYALDTTASYRERINYQKVSFLPMVELKQRRGELFSDAINYNASVNTGIISELSNTKLTRWGGKVDFYKDFYGDASKVTPALGAETSKYSNEQVWTKLTGGVDLTKKLTDALWLESGYLHYFNVEGQSPFLYEMYKFRAADKVYSSLTYHLGIPAIKVYASYFADDWSPEDIDYSLFLNLHCYNIFVTYRSIRNEFNLGFDIGVF